MPGFVNLTTVVVTGTYRMIDGSIGVGNVRFTPTTQLAALIDSSGKQIIVPETIIATLDAAGHFSVALPATDDPDITPEHWTYHVVENLQSRSSVPNPREYDIEIPVSAVGDTIDLAQLAPANPLPDIVTYVLIGDFNDLTARVAALEAYPVEIDLTAETAVVAIATDVRTFIVPAALDGRSLASADGFLMTASSSGAVQVGIRNLDNGNVAMLATPVTIAQSVLGTYPPHSGSGVLGTAPHCVVHAGDRLTFDVPAAGTGAHGLRTILTFVR